MFITAQSALAHNNDLDKAALNNNIDHVVSAFNNSTTDISANVSTLERSPSKLSQLQGTAHYNKVGPKAELKLTIDNFKYVNSDAAAIEVSSTIATDASKLFSSQELNNNLELFYALSSALVEGFKQKYGAALNLKQFDLSLAKDDAGNSTGSHLAIDATVDLAQLPEPDLADQVLATSVQLDITLDIHKGITFKTQLTFNPQYADYQKTQQELKETVEKMIVGHEETMQDLFNSINQFDINVTELLSGEK